MNDFKDGDKIKLKKDMYGIALYDYYIGGFNFNIGDYKKQLETSGVIIYDMYDDMVFMDFGSCILSLNKSQVGESFEHFDYMDVI